MKSEIFVHSLRRKIFFKKQSVVFHIFILLHRSPGRSSPRLCAGDESGFFCAIIQQKRSLVKREGDFYFTTSASSP